MAGIRFAELAEMFIGDLEKAGATVIVEGGIERRPLRCRVSFGQTTTRLDVYLWTITSGGKGRGRPRERRIQVTAVERMPLRPGVRTVLGGWSEEAGVYAFWDARRHQGFSAGSPSLQIDLSILEQGYHSGFAAETRHVREGEEIGIAVQPDFLVWYLDEWERLYECGADIDKGPQLVGATVEEEREFVDTGFDDFQRSRRHKVIMVVHQFREARFRPSVLRAYSFRCCVTGLALRIVDAAHIMPVTDPRSTDETWNGLALSANHHRAYDNGLLGILPGGRIALNARVAGKLKKERLSSGLELFCQQMPRRIQFPVSQEHWPHDDALMHGLIARGWTEKEIDSGMKTEL